MENTRDEMNRPPLKLVASPKPPLVLKRVHIDILTNLRDCGSARATLFDEEALDELFKARPRLICLVAGHVNAVVDITTEGLSALMALNGKARRT